jgi:hypothetical protein
MHRMNLHRLLDCKSCKWHSTILDRFRT